LSYLHVKLEPKALRPTKVKENDKLSEIFSGLSRTLSGFFQRFDGVGENLLKRLKKPNREFSRINTEIPNEKSDRHKFLHVCG